MPRQAMRQPTRRGVAAANKAAPLPRSAAPFDFSSIRIHAAPPLLARQPKPTAPTPTPSCTPRTGVTEYGCYCGAGSSCGSGFSCTPSDDLDACCRDHDRGYGRCSYVDRYNPLSPCCSAIAVADFRLCTCALRLLPGARGAKAAYLAGVIGLFCGPPPCMLTVMTTGGGPPQAPRPTA
jgi:hypothetical protein